MKATLKQLEAFIIVAECRSVSEAARKLHVSQPAVTRTISELESTLGVELIERSARGVAMTSFGEALLSHARTVLAELRSADEELAAMQGAAAGRVAIGTSPTGAAWLVPEAVSRLALAKPDALVTVMEARSPDMLAALRAGELDIVIAPLAGDERAAEFVEEELYRDELSLIVGRSHPQANGSPADLKALRNFPWIIPPIGTRLGALIGALFRRAGVTLPSSRIETQAMYLVRTMLLETSTHWVAPLPKRIFRRDVDEGRLRRLEFPSGGYIRPIGFLTRARGSRSPLVNAFIRQLREVAKTSEETAP